MISVSTDIWANYINFAAIYGGSGIPLPVQLGVKAWGDISDPSKYVEGDTDKIGEWLDSSVNGNDYGQVSGLLQPEYDPIEGQADFDESNDNQLDIPSLSFPNDVHFDIYIKTSSTVQSHILADTNNAANNRTRIMWSGTQITIDAPITGSAASLDWAATPTLNVVNHLRIMRDSSAWTVELNGTPLTLMSGSGNEWPLDAFFLSSVGGQRGSGSSVNTFDGSVAGICLFDKALTAQEKSDLKTYLDGLYL